MRPGGGFDEEGLMRRVLFFFFFFFFRFFILFFCSCERELAFQKMAIIPNDAKARAKLKSFESIFPRGFWAASRKQVLKRDEFIRYLIC